FIKNVSQNALEERLDHMVRVYGSEELNKLRDQARNVASRLGMAKEFDHLSKLIQSAISPKKKALGHPYDPLRIELFAILANFLQQQDLPIRQSQANSP